jgi:hypothetical protein
MIPIRRPWVAGSTAPGKPDPATAGSMAPIRWPNGLYRFHTIPKQFQDQLKVFSFFSDNLPFHIYPVE